MLLFSFFPWQCLCGSLYIRAQRPVRNQGHPCSCILTMWVRNEAHCHRAAVSSAERRASQARCTLWQDQAFFFLLQERAGGAGSFHSCLHAGTGMRFQSGCSSATIPPPPSTFSLFLFLAGYMLSLKWRNVPRVHVISVNNDLNCSVAAGAFSPGPHQRALFLFCERLRGHMRLTVAVSPLQKHSDLILSETRVTFFFSPFRICRVPPVSFYSSDATVQISAPVHQW